MSRFTDHVAPAIAGLAATAVAAACGFIWSGLQEVSRQQVAHGQQLTHIAETIGKIEQAAERERIRLEAYMPRTEVESKLDVLRTAHSDHARRLDRLEARGAGR